MLTQSLGKLPQFVNFGEIFHAVRGPGDTDNFADLYLNPAANFFLFRERLWRADISLCFPSEDNIENIFNQYFDYLASLADGRLAVLAINYEATHHFEAVWSRRYACPALIRTITNNGIRLLHLKRRDIFAKFCSLQLAYSTDVWHSRPNAALLPRSLVLPTDDLAVNLYHMLQIQKEFSSYLDGYEFGAELYYEDMISKNGFSAGAAKVIAAVCKTKIDMPQPSLAKVTPALKDVVTNWSEVLSALRDTPFEGLAYAHFKGAL